MADLDAAKVDLDTRLRKEEGESLKPYLCTSGVATIGVGSTTYLDGRKVKLSDPALTEAQCERMLDVNITRYSVDVLEMVEGECTTNQLIGLVSCAYNIGLDGLRHSSMIRLHKAAQYDAAGRAFALWNKARNAQTGVLEVNAALTARRAREAAIYLTPDDHVPAPRPPQAVEKESSIASSPIMQGGVATAGLGAMLTPIRDAIGPVKDALDQARSLIVDTLHVPAQWLPAVLIAIGIGVAVWRWKQRRGGWV